MSPENLDKWQDLGMHFDGVKTVIIETENPGIERDGKELTPKNLDLVTHNQGPGFGDMIGLVIL